MAKNKKAWVKKTYKAEMKKRTAKLKPYTKSNIDKELGTDEMVMDELYRDSEVIKKTLQSLTAKKQPKDDRTYIDKKILKKKRNIVGPTVLDVVKKVSKQKPEREKFRKHMNKYYGDKAFPLAKNTYKKGE
tara:strand:- start:177 stop:569 length:393 start_codon:yes stop_codon:yes gene_type:complete